MTADELGALRDEELRIQDEWRKAREPVVAALAAIDDDFRLRARAAEERLLVAMRSTFAELAREDPKDPALETILFGLKMIDGFA